MIPEDFVISLVGKVHNENISEANFTNTVENREVKWLVQVYMSNYGRRRTRFAFFISSLHLSLPPFILSFLIEIKTPNIKFTILTIFKYTIQPR